jgi:hypothetical protein
MKGLSGRIVGACIAGALLSCSLAGAASVQPDLTDKSPTTGLPSSKHKPRAIKIRGCWAGPMTDDNGLTGSVSLKILQSKSKIVTDTGHNHGSGIDIEYDVGGFANGPISGTISGTSIKFKARFGTGGCAGNGNATVSLTPKEIQGSFDYNSECPSGLVHLTYDVKPAACPK